MSMKSEPTAAPAAFELPATTDLAAVDAAEIEVIRLAARGLLAPREAFCFSHMLDHRRRSIADLDFEQRMRALE